MSGQIQTGRMGKRQTGFLTLAIGLVLLMLGLDQPSTAQLPLGVAPTEEEAAFLEQYKAQRNQNRANSGRSAVAEPRRLGGGTPTNPPQEPVATPPQTPLQTDWPAPSGEPQMTETVGPPPPTVNPLQALAGGNKTPQSAAAGDLIGFFGSDDSGTHTIALVNTSKMQIVVYHIDRSGALRLISSRPIDADFSVTLNATDPLPSQIRLLQGRMK
ncbi:hypothetical protein CGZ80_23615 [Rhodopirellula sp. MGV]|nr:hypothetical protein CGZ80_23615 [Rhodopirellula sp. MGV]PNY33678.1 hypothetical protein C2E31_26600 [Rhodopirellula baltica]